MSRPRYQWWGYAKSMIRKYPDGCNEDERRAVEAAIEATRAKSNGDARMMVVELTLMKRSHSIAGAAMKAYCSESTAKQYHTDFVRLVGKHFRCNGLC